MEHMTQPQTADTGPPFTNAIGRDPALRKWTYVAHRLGALAARSGHKNVKNWKSDKRADGESTSQAVSLTCYPHHKSHGGKAGCHAGHQSQAPVELLLVAELLQACLPTILRRSMWIVCSAAIQPFH